MDQDDGQLIRAYVEERSAGAFEEVVRRHVGMVYAAALRQVKSEALAEDVTQAVFMVLMKKAGGLRLKTVGGWLLKVTRYAAIDVMRKERRHRRHEEAAAIQRPEVVEASDDWRELLPILDEAMSRLSDGDRDAVVLRYFEGREIAEIAGQMGVGEAAARKRVSRGVEKLRGIILRKGVVMTGPAVAGAIASNANAGVSAGLMGTILNGAGGCGTGASVAGSIANGALNLIAIAQAKVAMVVVGVILLVGGGAVMTARMTRWATTPIARPVVSASNAPAWQIHFDQVYRVTDGEDVQWIEQKDFPAARVEFGRPYFSGGNVLPDSSLWYFWDTDAKEAQHWGTSLKKTMGDVLNDVGIHRYELETADSLRLLDLGGDWIYRYRPDAPAEFVQAERLAVIDLIGKRLHRTLVLSSSKQEREVIVARGSFGTLPEDNNGRIVVSLSETAGGGKGSIKDMLGMLADIKNIRVIDETESSEEEARWVFEAPMPVAIGAGGATKPLDAAAEMDRTLADLTRQCGIEFKHERRIVTVWTLVEASTQAQTELHPQPPWPWEAVSPIGPEDFVAGKAGDRFDIFGTAARGGEYLIGGPAQTLFDALTIAEGDATPSGLVIVRKTKDGKRRILDISARDIADQNADVNVMIHSADVIIVLPVDGRLNRVKVIVTPDKLYMNGKNVDWNAVRAELEAIPVDRRGISFIAMCSAVKLSDERVSDALDRLKKLASELAMVKAVNAGAIADITVWHLGGTDPQYCGNVGYKLTAENGSLSKMCKEEMRGFPVAGKFVSVIRGIYEGDDRTILLDNVDLQDVLAGKHDEIEIQAGDAILLSKVKGATTRP